MIYSSYPFSSLKLRKKNCNRSQTTCGHLFEKKEMFLQPKELGNSNPSDQKIHLKQFLVHNNRNLVIKFFLSVLWIWPLWLSIQCLPFFCRCWLHIIQIHMRNIKLVFIAVYSVSNQKLFSNN